MKKLAGILLFCSMGACASVAQVWAAPRAYLGFDKNGYPGDAHLAVLHRTFAYTGYWLNNPPEMQANPWSGKRATLRAHGFGFLLLFNGRLYAQLKNKDAAALGKADGELAARSARREGFPQQAVIFLDQEEGGRLLREQAAYLGAWVDAVRRAGYLPSIYCSGIAVPDGNSTVSTAQDVLSRFPGVRLWVANDQCPPAPGCSVKAAVPGASGFPQAAVWQYAQSPRRPQYTAQCARTYAGDGRCYAPALPQTPDTFLDLDTALSADPSNGR